MTSLPMDDERRRALARRAAAHAESLAAAELQVPVMAEVVDQQLAWTESRLLCNHHLKVFQRITRVSVVFSPDDPPQVLGWRIDKRVETSQDKRFDDDTLVAQARALQQIGATMPLLQLSTAPIDAQRSFTIAHFGLADAASRIDVGINHSTGEVIGVAPVAVGMPAALDLAALPAADTALVSAGEAQAWRLIEASLAPGLDAATMVLARSILRFTPAEASRDGAGRTTLRYHLWRQYSLADVGIAVASDAIVSWYLEALQADAAQRVIGEADAVQRALPHLLATQGVRDPTVAFGEVGGEQKATVHWWHAEQGFVIEGDQTTVLLNADSGKVFAVSRKWRQIDPALLATPVIDEPQALRAASLVVAADTPGHVIGKSVIEIGGDLAHPDAVQDVPVWRVGFRGMGGVQFTEVAVDCRTAAIVRQTGW